MAVRSAGSHKERGKSFLKWRVLGIEHTICGLVLEFIGSARPAFFIRRGNSPQNEKARFSSKMR
jgi:hypothetical protein